MAGMSGPYVNQLERGRRTSTRAGSLLRLSSALGVRPEWLLYGHEPKRDSGRAEGQFNAIMLARIETHVETVIPEDRAPIKPKYRAVVVAAQYETFVRTGGLKNPGRLDPRPRTTP